MVLATVKRCYEKLLSYFLWQFFKTKKDVQLALFDYIEVFYNRNRIHSILGFQTPNEFGMAANVGVRFLRKDQSVALG
ncbi:IS3 family transposase [Legionella maceachernii]|uniref:IS3 family transposase n=1 Tax=Legionella maceachernii TaxID=466 RepID=UPI00072FD21D